MVPHYIARIDEDSLGSTIAEWHATAPRATVFALLPEAEKDKLPLIQQAFHDRGLRLFGAIFPALVTRRGFLQHGVIFLRFPEATHAFLVDDLADNADAGATRIADAAREGITDEGQHLFLVFDGMLGNVGSLLVRLFERLRRQVTYAGVNAGSETFQPMPCVFDAHRVVSNGAVGLLLPADHRLALQHAYPVSKALLRATSTSGNRIDHIDGRPAMTVYQEVIAEEYGIALTQANFYDYAVHYPFGLIGPLDVLVRIPVAFSEDGSIFCVGEVPPNSMLRLLKAPELPASGCVDDLVRSLGPGTGQPLITFYCAGRRMHFGEAAFTEIQDLMKNSASPEIFGALSLGEIGTDADLGIPQFHNAALVCAREGG